MTRLRKATYTFVSEEPKLYHCHSYSDMSPIPPKFIANYSIRGPAVPRACDTSFVMVLIYSGSRSHLTYTVAHPGFGKEGATTRDLGATPPAAYEFLRFSHKKHSF